jgi:predicted MFS family arabinose efflux permease
MVCAFGVNIGAATSNVFGPIILQRIVGFTPDEAVLLNMPFGALQFIMIIVSSYLAQRFKAKGLIFFLFLVPVVVGQSPFHTRCV